MWQLGRHRLLCGDSTDPVQVAALFAGKRAALTMTSPPYNLGHSSELSNNVHRKTSRYVGQADARKRAEYLHLLSASIENALAVSDTVIVNLQILAGNKVAVLEFLYAFRHAFADVAIWDKGSAPPAMCRNVMSTRFELLLFFSARKRAGQATRTIHTADFRGTVSNVYLGPPQRHNAYSRVHAATFPLHLPVWLMETFDSTKGAVFDPFLGTGTTLIAAQQSDRCCFGIEIEPAYCDLVLERFERVTGRRAVRIRHARLSA